MMKRVDDFRLRLGKHELVPIMIGGMGVDISTADLALEAARLGGVGHISDAMINTVADRRYETKHVKEKLALYKYNVENEDKSSVKFDLGRWSKPPACTSRRRCARKQGDGLVFINCMEKLTMNAPKETLKVRMTAALDAGIDGITLAAGLHLGSFALIEDHPALSRCQARHHRLFGARAVAVPEEDSRTGRLPDYVVVEGPLAGGHLGFGMDWAQYDLATIVAEVIAYLKASNSTFRSFPPAASSPAAMRTASSKPGPAAVQVATRFTVTEECGLPTAVKQEYFKANEDDIEVNEISPTGYPMRMIKKQPRYRRRHPPQLRSLRLPARRQRQVRLRDRLQPRGGAAPRGAQGFGDGQDLPVHAHAQLRYLDLRPD
jgi:nitronate monooxygenase